VSEDDKWGRRVCVIGILFVKFLSTTRATTNRE
jgi:hypothetical protein